MRGRPPTPRCTLTSSQRPLRGHFLTWCLPSSGAPWLTPWPHHLHCGSRARPGDCVPPAPIQGRGDGADAVSTRLPPDPRASTAQPHPRSRGGGQTHCPRPWASRAALPSSPATAWTLSPPAASESPSLRLQPHPAPCSVHRVPWPGKTPGPGKTPVQYRHWEGVGWALGVHEQCRDRVGAAEAWHYHPDLPRATSRDPQPLWEPGRLAAEGTGGPQRLGWSSAKGTARAGGTGWQGGSTGPHLPTGHSRGTGQSPRGAAVGRGLS